MSDRQTTLGEAFEFAGVGLHTGAQTRARVAPAPANAGIAIRRSGGAAFAAVSENVRETRRATVIGSDGASVSTIEHLLAALAGMGVDNAAIEVDGPEIPIVDGSAAAFVERIRAASVVDQPAARRYADLDEPLVERDGEALVVLLPAPAWRVRFTVDFPAPVGAQYFAGEIDAATFANEIAAARTFGYLHEVEALLASGLARGGTLENALVFSDDGPMTPLRWPNEVVRHKVLDLIGDFALLGVRPRFEILAFKSGHRLHAQTVAALRRRLGLIATAVAR